MFKLFLDLMKWLANPHPKTRPLIEQITRRYFPKNEKVQQVANVSPEELQQQVKILYGISYFVIVAGIMVFVYSAYHYQLGWTGFVDVKTTEVSTEKKTETSPIEKITKTTKKHQSGKTLWDWLDLLIVPAFLAGLAYLFQKREKEKEKAEQDRRENEQKQQDKRERELAQDNLAEEAIQAYLDNMSKLLLDKELRKELFLNVNDKFNILDKDNSVRDVARALTIAILRRLEGDREDDRRRQDVIFRFLRDAELHEFILKNAHLSEMDLSGTSLWNINLLGARLRNTNLSKADLEETNLSKANLEKANLEKANLEKANLEKANLSKANLEKANLQQANLKQTGFTNTKNLTVVANFYLLEITKLLNDKLNDKYFRLLVFYFHTLIQQRHLTFKQIKSACFWEKAIFVGEWNEKKYAFVAIEPVNTEFINNLLKKDRSSDPEEPPDCSIWSK